MTDRDRFDERFGGAHWLKLREAMVAVADFRATMKWIDSYDQEFEQFELTFPDGSRRTATIENKEWDHGN